MAKRHYIPITADVPGVNDSQRAFIRKVIRTALAAEGVDFPCEVLPTRRNCLFPQENRLSLVFLF